MTEKAKQLGYEPVNAVGGQVYTIGLTKREYFAAMAMQGLCACCVGSTIEQSAKHAVEYADALLEELSKNGTE